MTTLNDYLGSLVTSLTEARMLSDLQTAKIAEQYADHKLLQHFSIPRMRLGDVEMTIPVAVETPATNSIQETKPFEPTKLLSFTYQSLLQIADLKSLPGTISTGLRKQLGAAIKDLESNILAGSGKEILKEFSIQANRLLEQAVKKNRDLELAVKNAGETKERATKLAEALLERVKFVREEANLGMQNVITETHKLKEFSKDNLTFIKLNITEEGMEWHRFDDDTENRLLPE